MATNTSFPYEQATAASGSCILPDGRKLGFARYGSKEGPQILYLHGLPGSRFEAKAFYEKHLHQFEAGMICVERPGIGLSSLHPGAGVSDHARDVLNLARQLDLQEWRVIGVSGGAPYALACARHHPSESLRAVAICAGIGPFAFGYHGMALGTKATLLIFRYAPWLHHIVSRPLIALQGTISDTALVEMMQNTFSKPNKLLQIQQKDVEAYKKKPDLLPGLIASTKEHFRQGFGGYLQDGKCIAGDWDFEIEDITFRRIHIWHGRQDVNCPLHMAERLADLLGDGVRLNVVDETHMSTTVNYAEQVLRDLLKSV